MTRKIISIVLSVGLLFQQGGLAYAAGQLNLADYLSSMRGAITQPDRFQPARLRYISYDIANNDFKLLLDKGDSVNQKTEELKNQRTMEPQNLPTPKLPNSPNSSTPKLNDATQELFNYFLIGLALPNDTFWVNLRPDAPENIIDPLLEKTEIGKIFLEADLQLKKDTASLTSPQNPEGKAYWDKLYKKAGELFGTENITIPTITRPWIVPNEVIVRETEDSAYIYKATLKVMLEEDYLRGMKDDPAGASGRGTINYSFNDPRLKELNEYSTQLLREKIIPRLTKEVNSSKRYAKLRQVYYSLVLSRWFKQRYGLQSAVRNKYISLIDSKNLTGLGSQGSWDKNAYFSKYKDSFAKGEYNLKENIATPYGQSIRSYVSGGIGLSASPIMGGSFFRKGKDFLQKSIDKLDTFMDDTGVVRRREELRGDKKITGIDVYIAFGDIFSDDKAVTAENFDKLIEVFSKADATLVFEGKKDFLISIALILARFKKKGEYDPKEIRKELRTKLEDLTRGYGNEMRVLINQDALKMFFNNNKNPNFKKQLTELLGENKVIPAAESISIGREDLYNTNTVAARDLLNAGDNVLRIRDILNSEKQIYAGSPITSEQLRNDLGKIQDSLKGLLKEIIKLSRNGLGYNKTVQKVSVGLSNAENAVKKIAVSPNYLKEAIPLEDLLVYIDELFSLKDGLEKIKDSGEQLGRIDEKRENTKEQLETLSKGVVETYKAVEKLYDKLNNSSSAVIQEDVPSVYFAKGGIDLTDRVMSIKLERAGSFASTPLLLPQVKNAQGMDLDN